MVAVPDFDRITQLSTSHPKSDVHISYGTAGFRTKASVLDAVMFRMGLLASLRSKAKDGKAIGVMVTASHNPVQDNGVKLVDPYGEMLEQSWESYATKLAQAENSLVSTCLQEIVKEENIELSNEACVILARDTRPSSESLSKSVKEGVEGMGGKCQDFGLLTTPQLHYIVCCTNTNGEYGEATEEGYYKKLCAAYLKIHKMMGFKTCASVKVDGANGVGALKAAQLQKHLASSLSLLIHNDGTSGVLNEGCGADFVKTNQKPPAGLQLEKGDCCVSYDGDADRIVYFYKDEDGTFHLLDGDKIACLIAAYIKEKLDIIGIKLTKGLGVVQTAYANGSSTNYLYNKMKVPVAIAKTGVKHLHLKAVEYDIGVYFEANGHGTIIYSKDAESEIRQPPQNLSDEQKQASEILKAFVDLTNQTVGDAISDMLLVEAILNEKQWTCKDWDKEYTDIPNKLNKVFVKDRRVIKTNEDETKVVEPIELQNRIDELTKNLPRARSFVRPSGTEDVVRVYAESESQASTATLSTQVSQLVYDICNGVGERPTLST
ncbi:phosphoacetylglucosamine mutase-like isoform X1 [Hydractinia symbiolongicarpus]|uniref:phosphoacetylglucosamine mutase-like isoform X1 n=2 Tax=Hydractinia symbiolongicarpus TaxID=13093 RepID=UPI002550D8DB|nr:phosphoacetylglucosamine mutase-like isoform X1 [Hydractinia symbiolongicarpus]XP_057308365.1 phosphoacetylglucosamine mutase-like isoform X1 [Hydractinia symbiolongicarpus]